MKHPPSLQSEWMSGLCTSHYRKRKFGGSTVVLI
jgi:hypothetical protein